MANVSSSVFSGNIDLSALRKKTFTIDNDENRVLALDTSDLSIVQRLSDNYPKLIQLSQEVTRLSDGETVTEDNVEEEIANMANTLKEIDTNMRKCIDDIFDSNVSELCAPTGSMYDPFAGQLRYEHIISALMGLYEENLAKEMKRVQGRMKSHTDKYVGTK